MMIPAIVLSSHTAGLGVIRALGVKGVPIVSVYYDKNDMGYVSKYVRERVFAPHPEDHEEEFVGLLMDYVKQNGSGLVVSADDATLSVLSRHKEKLEEHCIVACTGWEVAEKFIDKKYTYELAEQHGIPCPKTFMPKTVGDLDACAATITYPCLVKPSKSHLYCRQFRRKLTRVENAGQVYAAFREATEAGMEVMLQEYIPGDDSNGANYNSYYWDGRPLVEFTARKLRLYPMEFGVPSAVESGKIPEVVGSGRKILEALGYSGYSCTEFKKDPRDNTYKLLEVNGRHNRSTLLSVACGINFPWIEYLHLVHGEVPEQQPFREGLCWIDDVKDLVQMVLSVRQGVRYFKAHLEPYRHSHVYSVFDRNDLMPICKRVVNLITGTMEGHPSSH